MSLLLLALHDAHAIAKNKAKHQYASAESVSVKAAL